MELPARSGYNHHVNPIERRSSHIDDALRQLLGLLPLVPLMFAWLAARRWWGNRRALLLAATGWGAMVVAISELLGAVRLLTPLAVAIAWGIVGVAIVAAYWRVRGRPIVSPLRLVDRSWIGWSLAVGAGSILFATLVTSLVSPPNNWDSMAYHMTRVVYWIQNQSLAHYPTTILRQLHQNPLAELMILQFQILTGDDRFANLVQWGAFAGSALGASLVAQQLGATARGQVIAAVFVVTLPMGVLQASNTQNDIVLGFYLIAFASFLLWGMEQTEKPIGLPVVASGAALGLAVLTKATGYLFAFPLCAWFAIAHLRRFKLRAIPAGLVVAMILVMLNLGHGVRNARLYGSPLGPGREVAHARTYTYTNERITVRGTISNVVRNAALQLATGSPAWNAGVIRAVEIVHSIIRADISDPATTWQGAQFHLFTPGWNHSDYAANPLHVVLVIVATLLLVRMKAPGRRAIGLMLLCVFGGLLMFALVLRWQPWHARLHVPLFLLAAAPVGAIIGSVWNVLIAWSAGVLLVVLAWIPLLTSLTQPWIGGNSIFELGRTRQYFMMRPGIIPFYREVVETVRESGATRIGLRTDDDDYEYPLWRMLHAVDPSIRIGHVDVENESRDALRSFQGLPDLIIDLRGDAQRIIVPGEL